MGNMEDVVSEDGTTLHCTYYSLDELADAAIRRKDLGGKSMGDADESGTDKWAGGSFNSAVEMAKLGWEEQLTEALAIAESAVSMVEKDHEVQTFVPTWDVAGAEVDVARYLSGEPENMIDFPMAEISKLGKVITLCASVSYSSAIEPETIIRRGQVITAFAIILTRLGYSSELWIDQTCSGSQGKFSLKAMVKGPNDTIDPSRILYAYAHPTTLRRLVFAVENGVPKKWWQGVLAFGRGMPRPPVRNLPEGTIYLPELRSGHDVPDAHKALKDLLRQAGLLAE